MAREERPSWAARRSGGEEKFLESREAGRRCWGKLERRARKQRRHPGHADEAAWADALRGFGGRQ